MENHLHLLFDGGKQAIQGFDATTRNRVKPDAGQTIARAWSGRYRQTQDFAEVPPRVEYSLTEYGRTLISVVQVICDWGEKRLEKTAKVAVYN